MNNKTRVKCISPILHHNIVKVGDCGYIDGYVRGGDDRPYVICVFGKSIVIADFFNLEVIENSHDK